MERKGKKDCFRKGDGLGKAREKEMKRLKVGERRTGGEEGLGANPWHGTRTTIILGFQRGSLTPLPYPLNT